MPVLQANDAAFLQTAVAIATPDTVGLFVQFAAGYARLKPGERIVMERFVKDLFEKALGRASTPHELKHFVHGATGDPTWEV